MRRETRRRIKMRRRKTKRKHKKRKTLKINGMMMMTMKEESVILLAHPCEPTDNSDSVRLSRFPLMHFSVMALSSLMAPIIDPIPP